MLVDLHTHSTSSDGTYTPAKLVEAAAAAKIGVLALTDHDSVNGIVQAEAAAVNIKNAPRIIRGVELGTQAGEASVHILGYHIDISNERLLTHSIIYITLNMRGCFRLERQRKITQKRRNWDF